MQTIKKNFYYSALKSLDTQPKIKGESKINMEIISAYTKKYGPEQGIERSLSGMERSVSTN